MNHYPRMRGSLAAIAMFLLATTLAGCSPVAEAPAPSAVAGETPSLPPTPAPEPLDAVTTLVARPLALELRAADGAVVQSLDYLGDADAAVATLTTVLGASPTVAEDAGSNVEMPSTVHRWAGFELREVQYSDATIDAPRGPWYPNYRIVLTAAESGDVELTTNSARVVGESWGDFAASSDATKNGMCDERYGEIVVLPRTYADGRVENARNSVEYRASDDGTIIASVTAPRVMHRDGCA